MQEKLILCLPHMSPSHTDYLERKDGPACNDDVQDEGYSEQCVNAEM